MEINSFPDRLDLNDQHIKRAKEEGVKMVINTDAHYIDQLNLSNLALPKPDGVELKEKISSIAGR